MRFRSFRLATPTPTPWPNFAGRSEEHEVEPDKPDKGEEMGEFVSEDDIKTFEGWLKGAQGIDPAQQSPEALAEWREVFDELKPGVKVGLMKLGPVPAGEHRYAVAVREGSDLFLVLWVRRSRRGDVYVMTPRGDRAWDPHESYHVDGTYHAKSYGQKFGAPQKRQPLNAAFRGTENLGGHVGHGPKTVGAICDPACFSDVLEIPSGILGPRDGEVVVDLVEPGKEPLDWPHKETARRIFKDTVPWIVIRVGTKPPLS